MGEFFKFIPLFFHGCRRRFGLFSLVMALVALGLWGIGHTVLFGFEYGHNLFLTSSHGVMWKSLHLIENSGVAPFKTGTGFRFSYHGAFNCLDNVDTDWELQFCGFHVATGRERVENLPIGFPASPLLVRAVIVPYWFIILSLTLVSAYLLLITPRASNPKMPDELNPEKAEVNHA